MWEKQYRDYPVDKPLIRKPIKSNDGLIGCEMHEPNGWNDISEEVFFKNLAKANRAKSQLPHV